MLKSIITAGVLGVVGYTSFSTPPSLNSNNVSNLEVEASTIGKVQPIQGIVLSEGAGSAVIEASKPTQEEIWATRIDQYIAEYNPNISNQGCGDASGKVWVDAGAKYGNHPYFLVAIARADTSLGKGLTNKCNLGNTGHCDSCAKGHQYNSFANSIFSISQTLSNRYLGNGTKSCHYSKGGWVFCPEGQTVNNGKFYASSLVNWNRNVNDTMAWLHGVAYRQDFEVKI